MLSVQHSYDGGSQSLTLSAGDRVRVMKGDESDTEWWLVRRLADGATGYFPASFITNVPKHSQ